MRKGFTSYTEVEEVKPFYVFAQVVLADNKNLCLDWNRTSFDYDQFQCMGTDEIQKGSE